MRTPPRSVAVLAMLAAFLTACGVSNAGTSGSSNIGAIRIAVMGAFAGQLYTPGADNAFKMAVDEINSSGGINGQKIEYKEFDVGATPQGGVNGTSLALQYNPTFFIGFTTSTTLKAPIDMINQAGVPVIHTTLPSLTSPKSLGSNLTFRLSTNTAMYAFGSDEYLYNTLGVKRIMLINTDDVAPTEGGNYLVTDAIKAGASYQHRTIPVAATDLTEPILAAKAMNAQAIWEWGYPTTDALTVKTAAANGFDGYVMTFSAATAARNGIIPINLLTDKVMAVNTCVPYVLSTPEAKKYVAAYKAKYGVDVTDSVTSTWYDAVYIYKEAVLAAGSTEPKAVASALSKIDHKGVCGQEKTDANHNLIHSVELIKYTGGTPVLVKNVENVPSPY